MRCSKCQTRDRLEKHHVYPVCHFGGKRDGLKICLCRFCHMKIEFILLSVESYVGDVQFGTRFKLTTQDYDKITRHYIKDSKIVYLTVQWSVDLYTLVLILVTDTLSTLSRCYNEGVFYTLCMELSLIFLCRV